MNFIKLSIYALAATFMATSPLVSAEEPLDEAELFFELNDTDEDLGIHGFADGGPWKEFEIEDPKGREMMEIDVKGRLKRQGLTEIFFESAEPTFDELKPKKFFRRFPQGWYEMEVELLGGGESESDVFLSQVIPAAPVLVSIGGVTMDLPEDCDDEDNLPVVVAPVKIVWEPVTKSHMKLGKRRNTLLTSRGNDVISYEFAFEIDETPFKSSTIIPAGVTEWTIPEEFFEFGLLDEEGDPIEEYKFEILVRVDNSKGNPGNKTAVENCFIVEAE